MPAGGPLLSQHAFAAHATVCSFAVSAVQLDYDRCVKVADAGLAKLAQELQAESTPPVRWMAPESLQQKQFSSAT
jgi:hypothetical protein